MKRICLSVLLVVLWTGGPAIPDLIAEEGNGWKPKRLNKVIELWESGQPVYYTSARGGFEEGRKMTRTWADYITYDMEHAPFDLPALREFMRGLVEGGPTKSGHRTPAVVVTLPVGGRDKATMLANHWMVQQVLATGVHGLLLCHAEDPEAVRQFVRAARYPFHRKGLDSGELEEGLRGNGGQNFAAEIWGLPVGEYLQKADVWPLHPQGELILGLKLENRHALVKAEESAKVLGIAFAEWGPGDMGMSFGYPQRHDDPYPEEMLEARAKVLAACKAAKIAFLNVVRPENVEEMIREGVMIGAANQAAAEKGRRFTGRKMPW